MFNYVEEEIEWWGGGGDECFFFFDFRSVIFIRRKLVLLREKSFG